MILVFMNKLAFIEILIVISAITGIILVLKEKRLPPVAKILWLFFVLAFNFIAVFIFIAWKMFEKKHRRSMNAGND